MSGNYEAGIAGSQTITKLEVPKRSSHNTASNLNPELCLRSRSSFVVAADMRAAVVTAPGKIEIIRAEVPNPGPHELLVRIAGCGVCASNLPAWEGKPWFTYPMPFGALGHEAWGQVAKVGSAVRDFEKNDRVVIVSSHAYADYDICDASCAVKISSTLNAQPMPGEPLGCAMNIFSRSKICKNDIVAIVGIGFLGALLTRLATAIGARVIAVSRREASFDLAREMGAMHVVPLAVGIDEVKKLTNGRFCDVVIECTGKQQPLDVAGEITRERGRLVIAGYHQDGSRQINMQLWNWRGLDVINAHEREPRVYVAGIRRAMRAIEAGVLKPTPLYTHFFPLEKLADALNTAASRPRDFIKAVIIT